MDPTPIIPTPGVEVSGALESAENGVSSAVSVISEHVKDAVVNSGVPEKLSGFEDFWHRLWSDPIRLILCVVAAVIIGKAISTIGSKLGIKTVATVAGSLFAFYIIWHGYSGLTQSDAYLFWSGEPGFSTLAASTYSTGWLLAFSIFGFVVGALVAYMAKKKIFMSLVTGVSVWLGVVLIFYIVNLVQSLILS